MFSIFKSSCSICKRKVKPLFRYKNDSGKVIKICSACREYAERRAYQKVK